MRVAGCRGRMSCSTNRAGPRGGGISTRGSVGLVADLGAEGVEGFLGVAEEHGVVGFVEDGVFGAGVAATHGSFQEDGLLRFPDLDHRHTGDDGVGVLDGGGVDGIVGADDEGDVRVREVVVDLVHFVDDVVGDAGFGEEDVQLARHPSGDGVDGEAGLDALVVEGLGDVGDGVLGLGDGEAVAGDDDDARRIGEELGGGVDVDFGVGAHVDGALGRSRPGDGAVAAEDDVADVAVHGLAHDVGEDGAGGADEGADHRQEGVVQHEAFGAQSPARVGVQDGDDDRHVGAADRGRHVQAEGARKSGRRRQGRKARGGRRVRAEEGHRGDGGGAHAHV
mmetsp:Transcript_24553/g.75848  ORF Transcript_24553/g.75848 Transcript_24553/m.75848 type:complete len:336 (-) Transcript_24553:503-1510(-)